MWVENHLTPRKLARDCGRCGLEIASDGDAARNRCLLFNAIIGGVGVILSGADLGSVDEGGTGRFRANINNDGDAGGPTALQVPETAVDDSNCKGF